MVIRPTRVPLPGRRMAGAAFGELVELAPLDVLVAEVPVVVGGVVCGGVVNVISNEDSRDTEGGAGVTIGRGPTGDDVEFVGAAPETETLFPIVVTVVQDDVGGAG